MKSLTIGEVRRYCTQPGTSLTIDGGDTLYYEAGEEHCFCVHNPPEFRRTAKLAYDLLTVSDPSRFHGGLIWLLGWQFGVNELVRPGWRILEDMRRAHGDMQSLDIAPAQYFRHDEFVELHAYLLQVISYGWPAYYLPAGSDFFVEFRSSERFFCYAREPKLLGELSSKLGAWGPMKDDTIGAQLHQNSLSAEKSGN